MKSKDVENDSITYDWKETGRLEISFQKNDAAVLRFDPSDEAVEKMLSRFRKRTVNQRKGGESHQP